VIGWALLLLAAQDAPPSAAAAAVPDPETDQAEEIVVRATYGRTTMLFDKGRDGKLYNCRIMVSSGSQRRDTNACQATPVCFEKTRDEVTECVELTAVQPALLDPTPPAKDPASIVFDVTQPLQPKTQIAPVAIGPSEASGEDRETERQRVKLGPVPKAPTDGPVIRFSNGAEDRPKDIPR
jgi:hypothetical protein